MSRSFGVEILSSLFALVYIYPDQKSVYVVGLGLVELERNNAFNEPLHSERQH